MPEVFSPYATKPICRPDFSRPSPAVHAGRREIQRPIAGPTRSQTECGTPTRSAGTYMTTSGSPKPRVVTNRCASGMSTELLYNVDPAETMRNGSFYVEN